jgi:hypothetical protein
MLDTITLPDETEVDFPLNDENLRKFRLVGTDGFGEGPWFYVHPNDVVQYDADVNDDTIRYGVAANRCLNGLPYLAAFPYRLRGAERPEVLMDDVIGWSNIPVYHSKMEIDETVDSE